MRSGAKIPRFLNQNQIIFSSLVQPGSILINFNGDSICEIALKIGKATAEVMIANKIQLITNLLLNFDRKIVVKLKNRETRNITKRLWTCTKGSTPERKPAITKNIILFLL